VPAISDRRLNRLYEATQQHGPGRPPVGTSFARMADPIGVTLHFGAAASPEAADVISATIESRTDDTVLSEEIEKGEGLVWGNAAATVCIELAPGSTFTENADTVSVTVQADAFGPDATYQLALHETGPETSVFRSSHYTVHLEMPDALAPDVADSMFIRVYLDGVLQAEDNLDETGSDSLVFGGGATDLQVAVESLSGAPGFGEFKPDTVTVSLGSQVLGLDALLVDAAETGSETLAFETSAIKLLAPPPGSSSLHTGVGRIEEFEKFRLRLVDTLRTEAVVPAELISLPPTGTGERVDVNLTRVGPNEYLSEVIVAHSPESEEIIGYGGSETLTSSAKAYFSRSYVVVHATGVGAKTKDDEAKREAEAPSFNLISLGYQRRKPELGRGFTSPEKYDKDGPWVDLVKGDAWTSVVSGGGKRELYWAVDGAQVSQEDIQFTSADEALVSVVKQDFGTGITVPNEGRVELTGGPKWEELDDDYRETEVAVQIRGAGGAWQKIATFHVLVLRREVTLKLVVARLVDHKGRKLAANAIPNVSSARDWFLPAGIVFEPHFITGTFEVELKDADPANYPNLPQLDLLATGVELGRVRLNETGNQIIDYVKEVNARENPQELVGQPLIILVPAIEGSALAFRVKNTVWFEDHRGRYNAAKDIDFIAIHELGHLAGLDHVTDEGTVRWRIMRPDVKNIGPHFTAGEWKEMAESTSRLVPEE